MSFKSYETISNYIFNNLYKIPENIDLVVGIDRSGMIIALMIANYLHKNAISFDEFIDNNFNIDNIKNVLITDDTVVRGNTLRQIEKKVKSLNKFDNLNIKFLAVYSCTQDVKVSDVIMGYNNTWFQFCLFYNGSMTSVSMYQIQGNLCRKPTKEEMQDEEKYLDYINNVKPYQRPNKKSISCIITDRPEKYRKQTQEWLKKYNYKYNKLIMMPQNINDKVKYKGQIYKNSSEKLYISNNKKQSIEINKIANKQVLCTQTMQIIQ